VQGVAFRWSAVRAAQRLGVQGWVRNLSDGGVEAQVEGNDEEIAAFTAWMGEGPPAARVDHVDWREVPTEGARDFGVRW